MTIGQDYRRGKVTLESLAHEIFAAAHPGWVVAGRTALVGAGGQERIFRDPAATDQWGFACVWNK
jgi:hypothetical protein